VLACVQPARGHRVCGRTRCLLGPRSVGASLRCGTYARGRARASSERDSRLSLVQGLDILRASLLRGRGPGSVQSFRSTPSLRSGLSRPQAGHSLTAQGVPIVVERSSSGDVIAVLVRVTIDGRRYLFKVDTGATQSEISTSMARADRLPADGPAESVRGLGCRASAQPVRVANWRVGNVPLPLTSVVAQTRLPMSEVDGEPFGGLLGSDVLSHFSSVTFDFLDDRLILNARAVSSGSRAAMSTHHQRNGATYETVALRLDGSVGTWIVDTGSPLTLISALTDDRDHLRNLGRNLKISSATRCVSNVEPVLANRWSLGPIQLPATVGLVSKQPIVERFGGEQIAGILGVSVLGNWDRATFDFANHTLALYNAPVGDDSPIGVAIVGGVLLLLTAIGIVLWRRPSRPT
jgi:hypothetical protein